MTDVPSKPADATTARDPIVYVRPVRSTDLPEAIRAQTGGLEQLYAIHSETGECLALVPDRRQAFVVARRNDLSPVSVH